MNVLEKILEEIENEAMTNKEIGRKQCEGMARAMNIIRSHMVEKERVTSAKIISREIDGRPYYEIKFKKVGEDEYTVGYGSYKFGYVVKWLNDCFEFCGETKVSCYNDGWVPCSERLPEEEDSMFAKFKGTDKWSNPMFEKKSDEVNITYELENGTRKTGTSYTLDGKWKIEKENRIVKKKVVAWQPLPKPYRPDPCHGCFGAANNDCRNCDKT